jgi:hypothetical protein
MGVSQGVRQLFVEQAISDLKATLVFCVHEPTPATHEVITVSGAATEAGTLAFGRYLTALVAGAVTVDLRVVEQLLGEGANYEAELRRELEAILGTSNDSISQSFREDRRNPWIAEALAHALVIVSRGEVGFCIPALVHAVTLPHDKPSQQGLDLVAVYTANEDPPGLCVGESKASENFPDQHLSKSMQLFREIDDSKRNYQIRTVVLNTLFANVPAAVRSRMVELFWEDRRVYMPVISYSTGAGFTPTTDRPKTFGSLKVPIDDRRFVVLPLENYHDFFDAVAESMRAAVEELV